MVHRKHQLSICWISEITTATALQSLHGAAWCHAWDQEWQILVSKQTQGSALLYWGEIYDIKEEKLRDQYHLCLIHHSKLHTLSPINCISSLPNSCVPLLLQGTLWAAALGSQSSVQWPAVRRQACSRSEGSWGSLSLALRKSDVGSLTGSGP